MLDDLDEALYVDMPQGGVHSPVVAAAYPAVSRSGAEEDATPGHTDPLLRAVTTVEDDHLEASPVPVDHDHADQGIYLRKRKRPA